MKHLHLPRWVMWSAAIVFLILPIVMTAISLMANVAYFSQFGYVSMLVAGASDIARFFLPIVIVILGRMHLKKLAAAYILVSVFSAWAGINFAADTRMQSLWTKTEHAEVFDDNKAYIGRLVRDLGQITETGASVALKGQIDVLESRKEQLTTDIDIESDPAKNGPCRTSCDKLKDELKVVMTQLTELQERFGQALKREQLEKDLAHARQKRETAKPVEVAGFSQFLNFAFGSAVNTVDMTALLINVLLYLLLVEGLSHLIGPAVATVLYVAHAKPNKEEENVTVRRVEDVPAVVKEEPSFEPMVLAPVIDEDDELVDEQPVVEVEQPKAERKRRKDGRFAKKPGRKPVKKLKLADLVKDSTNVVSLADHKKD